jgi:urea transport system permease protein
VPQVGIINPSEFAPTNSIEIAIWVAVGGRGTLVGAALGAVLVNFAKTYFTAALPLLWLFALGALFVLVTIFLPKGLLGLAGQVLRRKVAHDSTSASTPSAPNPVSASAPRQPEESA